VARQCALVGLPRSSLYYQPSQDTARENLHLMRLIDEQYTRTPFYGSPRMTIWLRNQGYVVNHKRIARLMQLMGLQAIYPKPKSSVAQAGQAVYPYLLRHVTIERVNQVWSTDITYVRLPDGWIYLVAILDWFSRYVLAWRVSITMERWRLTFAWRLCNRL
jgi:putative transposase